MVYHNLRDVQGAMDIGLYFTSHSTLDLCAFSNADWANYSTTRHFTTGYCIFLGRNFISWCAKKQHIVSWSSTEAEYSHCQHRNRTYMTNLYSKRSSPSTLFSTNPLLWQSQCSTYKGQSSVSCSQQTHWVGLPFCVWASCTWTSHHLTCLR